MDPSDVELLPPAPYPTGTEDGGRNWVFPRRSEGALWRKRRAVAVLLVAIYTALPHLKVGGMPAVLLDIPARRFTLLGATFGATDTLLLALLLIGVVVSIVSITAMFGRVWCGWACPQTVYLEFVFRPIENWLEGQGEAQRRFHRDGADAPHLLRGIAKYVIYLAISMALAHTFLAYFVGVEALELWVRQSPIEHPFPFLLMVGMTGAMMFDFVWFREQMCTVACPYARLQAVMFDRQTIRVAYDSTRGEPRGKFRKGPLPEGAPKVGDCVDCKLCVQVCPTGIDIRNGLQLECVSCAQCIDACDGVMTRLGRPTGLIRHSSEEALEGGPSRIFKPRLVIYATVLAMVVGGFLYLLTHRTQTDMLALRAVGTPYETLPDGRVSNHLKLKLTNKTTETHTYSFELVNVPEGQLVVPLAPVTIKGGEMATVEGFVTLPESIMVGGGVNIEIRTVRDGEKDGSMIFHAVGPEKR